MPGSAGCKSQSTPPGMIGVKDASSFYCHARPRAGHLAWRGTACLAGMAGTCPAMTRLYIRLQDASLNQNRPMGPRLDITQFAVLLDTMTLAAEAADGERFAQCFTEDATYHDYIYGPHTGRKDIAHMLADLFRRDAADDYRWEFF